MITKNDNTVSGTFDDTSLDSPGATRVAPVHASFNGTIDGSAITLTFPEGLGFSTTISGSLGADKMTLQIPRDNGQLAPITLAPGSVEGYNRLAAGIGATASANASASAAAARADADAKAAQDIRNKINNAAGVVASDLTAVSNADHTPDYSTFDNAIKQANNDVAQTKADAAKAATEGDQATACGDADTAQGDADTVQGDADTVQGAIDTLTAVISEASHAVTQVNQDLAAYRQAAATMPSYIPSNAPNIDTIQPILDNLSKHAAQWTTKGDQYQAQAARLVRQANDIAKQAQRTYCS